MTKQIKRKLYLICSIIMAVAVILGVAPQFAFASSTEDPYAKYFSGGDGSASNPYLITDYEQLENIKHTYDYDYDEGGIYCTYKSFKLVNDITITSDWVPIDGEFYGTLDGNGKTIHNLNLILGSGSKCGLFADNAGTIKNLSFKNASITNSEKEKSANFGIVAGINNGTISNCTVYSSCKINVDSCNANVGGIAGASYYGGIYGCINYANITGQGNIGGIVGYSFGTHSYNCKNWGTITYMYYRQNGCAAGIIGKAENNTYIELCTNYGSIVYGSPMKVGDNSIKPCMAQIVGWAVSATCDSCAFSANKTNYDNLYKGLFINQKEYCSEGEVGRKGKA